MVILESYEFTKRIVTFFQSDEVVPMQDFQSITYLFHTPLTFFTSYRFYEDTSF
jgi:hypothetical protein